MNTLQPDLCGDDPLTTVRLPLRSLSSTVLFSSSFTRSLSSTDNLTKTTTRQNTYQLKLTIHKK